LIADINAAWKEKPVKIETATKSTVDRAEMNFNESLRNFESCLKN
jgi:hypothetical protein